MIDVIGDWTRYYTKQYDKRNASTNNLRVEEVLRLYHQYNNDKYNKEI